MDHQIQCVLILEHWGTCLSEWFSWMDTISARQDRCISSFLSRAHSNALSILHEEIILVAHDSVFWWLRGAKFVKMQPRFYNFWWRKTKVWNAFSVLQKTESFFEDSSLLTLQNTFSKVSEDISTFSALSWAHTQVLDHQPKNLTSLTFDCFSSSFTSLVSASFYCCFMPSIFTY